MSTKATSQQLKYFYFLTRQQDLKDMREGMALAASDNRTNDVRELTTKEMSALITNLTNDDVPSKMRRKIFSLSYTIGWGLWDETDMQVPDYKRIDNWMVKYSYLHKPLMHYKESELSKLVTQFEQFVNSELKSHVN